jgi:N-ethylmaleimide reductase
MSVISMQEAAHCGKAPGLEQLFEPLRVGALRLGHRVVLGPWPLGWAGSTTGVPTPAMVTYYAQRATPGALVVCEPVAVAQGGRSGRTPGLFTAAQVNNWREVTDAIHAREAYAVAHLAHPGASLHGTAALEPVLEDYRSAAENAGDAGFDAVELDAGPAALPVSLLADYARHTTGIEKGIDEGRGLQLLTDVVQALTGVWPPQRVGVWLRAGSAAQPLARRLALLNIGYLHAWAETPGALPALRRVFNGPLLMALPGQMPPALRETAADAYSFGEAFMLRPDLVEWLRQARLNQP